MNENYLVKMKRQKSKTNEEMGINKLEIRIIIKNVNVNLWNKKYFFLYGLSFTINGLCLHYLEKSSIE